MQYTKKQQQQQQTNNNNENTTTYGQRIGKAGQDHES